MQPSQLKLLKDKSGLEVAWGDRTAVLRAEFLRVESPSAEVKGHGFNAQKLVSGKRNVVINGVEAVGNYAVKLIFSDGHATGLFTWALLRRLADEEADLWAAYERDLAAAGLSRDVQGAMVPRPQIGV
jgi:DUF971 family protein